MRTFVFICVTAAALVSCSEYQGERAPLDALYFPVGVAIHPSGQYAYVANSNFDARYRSDVGGTVTVVDLETMDVVSESTMEIGSFAGDLVLNAGRDGMSDPDRLYVTVRGDNSVVALEVSDDGRTLNCPRETSDEGALACRILDVAANPFALTMVPRPDNVVDSVDVFAVAGLEGEVSFISLDNFAVRDAEVNTLGVVSGASAIAHYPVNDEVWVAGRFSRVVRGLKAFYTPSAAPSQPTRGEVAQLVVNNETYIPNTTDISEVRDIAFSLDGNRAYVTTNSPSAIFVIDMTLSEDDEVRGTVLNRFDVDGSPARMVVTEERGREVIYAALAADEAIAVYDAASGTLLETITTGGVAYSLVMSPDGQRLFCTVFDTHQLAVLDVDPSSPTFRSIVGRSL